MGTAAGEMNLGALLPSIGTAVGLIEFALWLAILAGPLMLLGFGLLFRYRPPAEANFGVGYRFWWGMASLEAWQFTQHIAGLVWSGLGVVLTVIMALICNAFRRMEPMDMVWSAVSCLIWEVVLVAIACLAINIIVIRTFDKDGFRRDSE